MSLSNGAPSKLTQDIDLLSQPASIKVRKFYRRRRCAHGNSYCSFRYCSCCCRVVLALALTRPLASDWPRSVFLAPASRSAYPRLAIAAKSRMQSACFGWLWPSAFQPKRRKEKRCASISLCFSCFSSPRPSDSRPEVQTKNRPPRRRLSALPARPATNRRLSPSARPATNPPSERSLRQCRSTDGKYSCFCRCFSWPCVTASKTLPNPSLGPPQYRLGGPFLFYDKSRQLC